MRSIVVDRQDLQFYLEEKLKHMMRTCEKDKEKLSAIKAALKSYKRDGFLPVPQKIIYDGEYTIIDIEEKEGEKK